MRRTIGDSRGHPPDRVSPRRGRAAAAAVGLVLAALPAPSSAQHPFTPGVAFGAAAFPQVDVARSTWAVQFDLFTNLSKDLEPLPSRDFERYNDIDHTIGVNQLGYGRTWRRSVGASFHWHPTVWASGGVVWDTPTEFLQNDFAHGIRLLTFVPREDVVEHVVVGVGTDQSVSWGRTLASQLDVIVVGGVGGALSTAWFDGYGSVGAEGRWGGAGRPWLALGVLGRGGLVDDPFVWEGFASGIGSSYRLAQAWLQLDPGARLGASFAPYFRVAHTWSRGPWAERGGAGPITERLWSVRLGSNAGQWSVEMWNDFVYKDLGPTFGLRIQWYS